MNFNLLFVSALAILIYVAIVWFISLTKKDASIMDIFWGLGFLLAMLIYSPSHTQLDMRHTLLLIIVSVWAFRLSLFIAIRNRNKPEDPRYRKWRADHGDSWWWKSFFHVFLLQGFLMWTISLPLWAASHHTSTNQQISLFDILGLILWISGFLFESISDAQLSSFRKNKNNKGRTFRSGLWAYTRHPNYFGEFLIWWGFYFFSVSTGGWVTIFSPLIMSYLLIKVSGVSMLDKLLIKTKPEYREYIKETPAFFPKFRP